MSLVALLAAGAALLLAPWVAARLFDGRAPARIVATFHVLALVGMLMLPVVLLACVAMVRPGGAVVGWTAGSLVAGYAVRVAVIAVRLARQTSQLAASTAGLPRSSEMDVHVLATGKPLAYALGAAVVISRGLLDVLDPCERNAVLAHEFAHVRLGHHRLLLLGRVAVAALGRVMPVRSAYAVLARELEVLADQAAIEEVGERWVLARALAKAVLADTPAPVAGLVSGGERDLAYRLDRLTSTPPAQDRRWVARWAAALLAVALLVILAVTFPPTGIAVGPAALALGWLYCRAVRPPSSLG